MAAARRLPKKAIAKRAAPSAAPNLMQKKHEEDAQKSTKRTKKQEDFDKKLKEKVTKCLRDNFGALSEQEQRHVQVDGLTLAQRLTNDKMEEAAGDKVTFSEFYFEKWRSAYTRAGSESAALEPKSDDLEIDPKLVEAVQASRQHGGSRQLLAQWMLVRKICPNQSEVCGLFSHAMELKPHLGGTHLSTLMSLCAFILKHGLHQNYVNEFAAIRPHLDRALTHSYVFTKSRGWGPDKFWEAYKDKAALVVDTKLVHQSFTAEGSRSGHEKAIEVVVNSSALGKKMFGFADEWLTLFGLGEYMTAAIKAELDGKPLAEGILGHVREVVKAEFDRRNIASTGQQQVRKISLVYRDVKIEVEADGAWGEFVLRLDLYVKEACRVAKNSQGKPWLTPLHCEDEFFGPLVMIERHVDEQVVKPFNTARNIANQQLSATRQRVGEHVITFWDENEEVLSMVDASIIIEAAFFRTMAKSGCQTLLREKVKDVLPKEAYVGDLKDVASAVGRVMHSTLYTFAARDVQSDVNVVSEWCKAVAAHRKPDFIATKFNTFLTEVQDLMKFLLTARPSGASTGSGPAEIWSGEKAMAFMLKAAADKVKAGSVLSLADLKIFDTFHWLMNPEQITLHSTWMKAAFSAGGSALVSVKASVEQSASSSSSSAASIKRKSSAEDLVATTMALFKRKSSAKH